MTIKAKWDKLRFGYSNTYTWVFVEGRMFASHKTKYDKDHKNKFNNKTFYEGTNIKREKLNSKLNSITSQENQSIRSAK